MYTSCLPSKVRTFYRWFMLQWGFTKGAWWSPGLSLLFVIGGCWVTARGMQVGKVRVRVRLHTWPQSSSWLELSQHPHKEVSHTSTTAEINESRRRGNWVGLRLRGTVRSDMAAGYWADLDSIRLLFKNDSRYGNGAVECRQCQSGYWDISTCSISSMTKGACAADNESRLNVFNSFSSLALVLKGCLCSHCGELPSLL